MSLDKAIEHKKEHRKQYKGAKLVDKSCRNNGDCPYCNSNRLHSQRVKEAKSNYQLRNYEDELHKV